MSMTHGGKQGKRRMLKSICLLSCEGPAGVCRHGEMIEKIMYICR